MTCDSLLMLQLQLQLQLMLVAAAAGANSVRLAAWLGGPFTRALSAQIYRLALCLNYV